MQFWGKPTLSLPASFADMVSRPNMRVEEKDHDFVIGSPILSAARVEGSKGIENHNFDVPAGAIECKTYLKKRCWSLPQPPPNSRRTPTANSAFWKATRNTRFIPDVVWHLYEYVRKYLTEPWVGGVAQRSEKGYLL